MADLTADRIARLRTWAERRNPDRSHADWTHTYYAFCPWCSNVGDPDQPDDDGNAHDLAIELLDEIERLRDKLNETESVLSFLVHDHQKIEAVRTFLNAEVVWVGKEAPDA